MKSIIRIIMAIIGLAIVAILIPAAGVAMAIVAVAIIVKKDIRKLHIGNLRKHPGNLDSREPSNGLIESMRDNGQIQTIQVMADPAKKGCYLVSDGWCRVLAAKELGWQSIEAEIIAEDTHGEANTRVHLRKADAFGAYLAVRKNHADYKEGDIAIKMNGLLATVYGNAPAVADAKAIKARWHGTLEKWGKAYDLGKVAVDAQMEKYLKPVTRKPVVKPVDKGAGQGAGQGKGKPEESTGLFAILRRIADYGKKGGAASRRAAMLVSLASGQKHTESEYVKALTVD